MRLALLHADTCRLGAAATSRSDDAGTGDTGRDGVGSAEPHDDDALVVRIGVTPAEGADVHAAAAARIDDAADSFRVRRVLLLADPPLVPVPADGAAHRRAVETVAERCVRSVETPAPETPIAVVPHTHPHATAVETVRGEPDPARPSLEILVEAGLRSTGAWTPRGVVLAGGLRALAGEFADAVGAASVATDLLGSEPAADRSRVAAEGGLLRRDPARAHARLVAAGVGGPVVETDARVLVPTADGALERRRPTVTTLEDDRERAAAVARDWLDRLPPDALGVDVTALADGEPVDDPAAAIPARPSGPVAADLLAADGERAAVAAVRLRPRDDGWLVSAAPVGDLAPTAAACCRAGLPDGLAPTQLRLMPIDAVDDERATALARRLRSAGVRADVDARTRPVGERLADGAVDEVAAAAVVGERERGSDRLRVLEGGAGPERERSLAALIDRFADADPAVDAQVPLTVE